MNGIILAMWSTCIVFMVAVVISTICVILFNRAIGKYKGETSGVIVGVCENADEYNSGKLDRFYESPDAVGPDVKKLHRVVEYTVEDVTYRKAEKERFCVKKNYGDSTVIRTVWFDRKNPGDFHLTRTCRTYRCARYACELVMWVMIGALIGYIRILISLIPQ